MIQSNKISSERGDITTVFIESFKIKNDYK